MQRTTVPAEMALVTLISADRSVSTPSVRLVHGMMPAIEEKLAFHEEAYISRDTIGELTGLEPTKVLPIHYPRQADEVGIIRMTRRGKYGMVVREDGSWRGDSSAWVLDRGAYRPRDIPEVELETEAYWREPEREAIGPAMMPTTLMWAKEPEAWRLAMALLHHAGLVRAKVAPQQAATILGKSRITGWRTLKRLAALGLYVDGWVDLSGMFSDPDVFGYPHEEIRVRTEERRIARWSVFTREGWRVRDMARLWKWMLPAMREERDDLSREYLVNVQGDDVAPTVRYIKRVLDRPRATGRSVDPRESCLCI